jgi:hypothetical protein
MPLEIFASFETLDRRQGRVGSVDVQSTARVLYDPADGIAEGVLDEHEDSTTMEVVAWPKKPYRLGATGVVETPPMPTKEQIAERQQAAQQARVAEAEAAAAKAKTNNGKSKKAVV